MKSNVDLTADRRFFRKNSISVRQLFKKTTVPWKANELSILLNKIKNPNEQVFITGNREQRQKAKYYKEMPNRCDRCGKILDMPWKRVHNLCSECNELLTKEYSKKSGVFTLMRNNEKYKNFHKDSNRNLFLNI